MYPLSAIHLLAQESIGADELYDIVVMKPREPVWPWFLWGGVLLLLACLIGWLLWYFLRSKPGHGPGPGQRAALRFRQIEQEREGMEAGAYVLALSETLKDYLSEKFQDPVRYETSQEFLRRIAGTRTRLPDAAQQELRDFLSEGDELKFGNPYDTDARIDPLAKRARNILSLCESISVQQATESPPKREKSLW